MRQKKQRLDTLVHERGLAATRSKAQGLIMAGEVMVNGVVVDKSGTKLGSDVVITVKQRPPYVSRGGEKLAGALSDFSLDVTNCISADVGASTGGFTDCLLQNGVARVYAIDVGYGQLAHKIRVDERVIVIERTNARYLEILNEPVNLVVVDASFISLKLLLPAIQKWLCPQADIVALIKPQFEAGKSDVSKGGVVKDSKIHARVIQDIAEFTLSLNFSVMGLTMSPIKGAKEGNTEFLIWLQHGKPTQNPIDFITSIETILVSE
ncbi:MAG: TlyA family RNA methyltransferase [Anaerolineae bacterium]|nr:TlyA family RNA methyltransferase [Anaerolineae bacterium]